MVLLKENMFSIPYPSWCIVLSYILPLSMFSIWMILFVRYSKHFPPSPAFYHLAVALNDEAAHNERSRGVILYATVNQQESLTKMQTEALAWICFEQHSLINITEKWAWRRKIIRTSSVMSCGVSLGLLLLI